MNNVFINRLGRSAVEDQALEIVERKGLGHPDTICDSVMNRISIELSKEYIKRFGVVLHHNVDKSLLAAGVAVPGYKGGRVVEPMRFIFGDRATFKAGDEEIPVNDIAERSAKQWLRENLRFLDPERHVTFQSQIKPGSMALSDIFARKGEYLGANDTSAAVGYAPFTRTENIIKDLERHLNSREFKKRFPESGEDIKLMGLRKRNTLNITVAMAFVDRFVESEADYFRKREEIHEAIRVYMKGSSSFDDITVDLNALDAKDRGIDGLYLTVTGTSAEAGDSGQVGRGNNVVGVIPLNRPMSSEAAAGKNPVSHVGKIYNALCYRIADRIIADVPGIRETYVWLLSQIGRPINKPSAVSAQVIPADGVDMAAATKQIDEIIGYEFEHLAEFCDGLAKGLIVLY
ncbi:S-adenosylmethionine synthetase [Candidatus Bathyarchaeota archaeon RBG_16_57_9]|nr:MAG: S-adenosylmethionine synthetase [Candidatus Bathyarchaeota archaeon RBG_16_57_9]